MRPPGRAELAGILDAHGLTASRALGQNFLAEPSLAERIAALARVGPGELVLEIGAGLGSLTVALAATGAEVIAVELDRRLVPILSERVEPLGVAVVQADAMTADLPALLGGRPATMVSNLPYNIATPLLLDLLTGVEQIGRFLVMVQREVGERLAAAPGDEQFGAVSVRVAYFATARIVARVPAAVFIPRPKVESVLVEIDRRPVSAVDPAVASYAEIDRLLSAGFATRRKMLRRSLGGLVPPGAFERAGIEETRRPEELAVEQWGALAAAVRLLGGQTGEDRR